MLKEINIDQYSEEVVSKKNRRKRLEADENRMIVDSLPSTGVHEEKRKDRDRRRNQVIRDVMKH